MRYSFISICAAIVVALALTSARAQQASPAATATPRALAHVPIPLPINAPKGWAPQQWASFRAKCQEYSDKAHSGTPLTRSQFTMLDTCGTFAPYPASATRPPTAGQPKSPPPGGASNAGSDTWVGIQS